MRYTPLILFVVLAAAGCGGPAAPGADTAVAAPTTTEAETAPDTSPAPSTTTSMAPAPTTTPPATPEPGATAGATGGFGDPLVAFEARWMCEVQRHSFPDLGAMEELRLEMLAGEGISVDEYAGLQDSLAQDPERRSAVLAAFQAVCSG